MKTRITTIKHLLFSALAGTALLAGCTNEHEQADAGAPVPVSFKAAMQTLTRTTPDGDTWVEGDEVGIYISRTGEEWPNAFLPNAENKKYTVSNVTTKALTPADGEHIYFPESGNVDVVAYYPYATPNENYQIPVDLSDQSNPAAIDLLYAKAEDTNKSNAPINLQFRHIFSKVTLNITAGDGLTAEDIKGLDYGDVYSTILFKDGYIFLKSGEEGSYSTEYNSMLSLYKSKNIPSDANATFSIIIPKSQPYIEIVIKVNGIPHRCNLAPDGNSPFLAGTNHIFPVTVTKRGIELGKPEISDWEVNLNSPAATQKPEVVLIKAGRFKMGSSDGSNIGDADGTGLNTTPAEEERSNYEYHHWVTLTKDFYMTKHEITNAQYAEFLNAIHCGSDGTFSSADYPAGKYPGEVLIGDSQTEWEGQRNWGVNWNAEQSAWQPAAGKENHPVVYVTWYGAAEYASWAGGALPTEAQWEYACRAGTDTPWFFGDAANAGDYAWYNGNSGINTYEVGQKLPNPWGLYDMHGNVNEWCADWHLGSYYLTPSAGEDPLGPEFSINRVMRSNFSSNSINEMRSACRNAGPPTYKNYTLGFRIVFNQ